MKNYGILASLDWNSNQWQDAPTEADLENTPFEWVKKDQRSDTCLNFGHKLFPAEDENYYLGNVPHFGNSGVDPKNAAHINVVFFKSKNYQDGKTYIVGFYAFPQLIRTRNRKGTHEMFAHSLEGNIRAKAEDIILLKNPVEVNENDTFLPRNKVEEKTGYNFLKSKAVIDLLGKIKENNMYLEFGKLYGKIIQSIEKKR